MNRLTHRGNKIPKREIFKAVLQWVGVVIPYGVGWVLTFLMGIFVALTSRKQSVHPQNKPLSSTHSLKYKEQGSSGEWEYWNSSFPLLKWWNNYEDGTLGEPSGKHSARVKGDERSFWSQYSWTCRNPFNYGKRSIPLFFCPVNDCIIEYWGEFELSDKEVNAGGWQFCKATNTVTGRTYYWWRWVIPVDSEKVRVAAAGFKIKPSHALLLQDEDDKDKAFTLRFPVKTTIE